eukprot:Sspe_Gene.25797::Locus_10462_Transcript_1_1_Confidence_1.000_Length_2522::g.25797::m.25797
MEAQAEVEVDAEVQAVAEVNAEARKDAANVEDGVERSEGDTTETLTLWTAETRIRRELEAREDAARKHHQELEALLAEMMVLRREVDEATQRVAATEALEAAMLRQREAYTAQQAEWTGTLEASQRREGELSEEVSRMALLHHFHTSHRDRARLRVVELVPQAVQTAGDFSALQQERDMHAAVVEYLECELGITTAHLDEARRLLTAKEASGEGLAKQLQAFEAELATRVKVAEEVERRCLVLDEEKGALQHRVNFAAVEAEELRAAVEGAREELVVLHDTVKALEGELKREQEHREQVGAQQQRELVVMVEEMEALRREDVVVMAEAAREALHHEGAVVLTQAVTGWVDRCASTLRMEGDKAAAAFDVLVKRITDLQRQVDKRQVLGSSRTQQEPTSASATPGPHAAHGYTRALGAGYGDGLQGLRCVEDEERDEWHTIEAAARRSLQGVILQLEASREATRAASEETEQTEDAQDHGTRLDLLLCKEIEGLSAAEERGRALIEGEGEVINALLAACAMAAESAKATEDRIAALEGAVEGAVKVVRQQEEELKVAREREGDAEARRLRSRAEAAEAVERLLEAEKRETTLLDSLEVARRQAAVAEEEADVLRAKVAESVVQQTREGEGGMTPVGLGKDHSRAGHEAPPEKAVEEAGSQTEMLRDLAIAEAAVQVDEAGEVKDLNNQLRAACEALDELRGRNAELSIAVEEMRRAKDEEPEEREVGVPQVEARVRELEVGCEEAHGRAEVLQAASSGQAVQMLWLLTSLVQAESDKDDLRRRWHEAVMEVDGLRGELSERAALEEERRRLSKVGKELGKSRERSELAEVEVEALREAVGT